MITDLATTAAVAAAVLRKVPRGRTEHMHSSLAEMHEVDSTLQQVRCCCGSSLYMGTSISDISSARLHCTPLHGICLGYRMLVT
jgi:hypothetical protein